MAKPSKLPEWDSTGINSVEPDATHKAEGWLAPGGIPEKPPFQTFNHWMNAVWKWIKEFNRQGIVEWDGTTVYEIDDYSKGSNGLLYKSLVAANTNNNPTISPTEWELQITVKASTAQSQAQTDDTTAISPLKLKEALQGSNQSLTASGYQKLPGGLIIQWGAVVVDTANIAQTFNLPIAYTTSHFVALSQHLASGSSGYTETTPTSTTQLTIRSTIAGSQKYFSIGY